MESNLNESKISVLFGDDIAENDQKSLFQIVINVGKGSANQQANTLKALTLNQVETNNSLIIVFPCASEDQEKLAQKLHDLFNGTAKSKMGEDCTWAYSSGKIQYQIVNTGDKVILVVRPGDDIEALILGQVNQFLDLGIKEIVETQQNKITLTARSLNTFGDITNLMGEGNSFFSALLKSLKVDLVFSMDQNLLTKVVQVIQLIDPSLEQSPLALIQYFKSFDIELKFSSTDELPNQIRTHLYRKQAQHGLAISQHLPEADKQVWREFTKLIEPGVEIYVTLEDIAALHIKSDLPEFSKQFLREIGN